MDYSMPGLPVHHQVLESTLTHAHWVGNVIQPSHPLLSPSPPAFNLSQHQGFFKWVSSLHQVAKVLEFQLQHQSFQWTPRTLGTGWIPCSPRDSQVFSNTYLYLLGNKINFEETTIWKQVGTKRKNGQKKESLLSYGKAKITAACTLSLKKKNKNKICFKK